MKKTKQSSILLLLVAMLFPNIGYGQCDTDLFLDQCAQNLGTYNYIKSFNISVTSRKKAYPEYSYVFSKGSKYMLIVCDEFMVEGKMVVNLYDREHNLLASSYDAENDKYYPNLIYSCSTTGVYYIQTTFLGSKGGCGLCILGFTKEECEDNE